MDDIDVTTERQEQLDSLALKSVSQAVADMSVGHPGECDKCGEWSERLVERRHFQRNGRPDVAAAIDSGICPPCRDIHKLP